MKIEYFRQYFKRYGDKLLFALALVFLAAALFRLAGNLAAGKPDAPSIVFTQWWEDGPEKETLEHLIKEFEDLHSEIKIILNTVSYEELGRALFNPDEALVQGEGTFPGDVIALDPLWVPELSSKKIIESANAPLLSFVNVFYYNIDILREAGFSRPPKTRNEFLSCARTLAGDERNRRDLMKGISSGLAMGLNSSRGIYDDVFPWIWSAGAQLIQDGKPMVTSRPVIESLSFLASLNSEGLFTPGAFSVGSPKKLEDFIERRAAFMIAPAKDIRFVRECMGEEAFGVTSIPIPDNYAGKTFFGTAGWTIGVSSASAHKEEARLFADFLAEKAPFLSGETMAIPGSGVPPAQDELYSKVWDIAIAGEGAADFSGLPWTELEKAFREELAALFAEKSSFADTAAAIQMKWEAVLER